MSRSLSRTYALSLGRVLTELLWLDWVSRTDPPGEETNRREERTQDFRTTTKREQEASSCGILPERHGGSPVSPLSRPGRVPPARQERRVSRRASHPPPPLGTPRLQRSRVSDSVAPSAPPLVVPRTEHSTRTGFLDFRRELSNLTVGSVRFQGTVLPGRSLPTHGERGKSRGGHWRT